MSLAADILKGLKQTLSNTTSLIASQKVNRGLGANIHSVSAPMSGAPSNDNELVIEFFCDDNSSESEPSPLTMDEEAAMAPIVTEDAVVYFQYDVENPPPRPDATDAVDNGRMSAWTRFVCISDTHCNTFKVPDGDILLHAGDLTHSGRFRHMEPTIAWLKSLPHPHKIIIAGNHDLTLDHDWYLEKGKGWHRPLENPSDVRKLLEPGEGDNTFQYLQYEATEITHGGKRWKVYGSPGSPWFGGWAFNYERETESQTIVNNIPEDVDILLTHGPPHRILDKTYAGIHAGCEALAPRVERIRPAIHIFGHIHEARGAIVKQWTEGTSAENEVGATNTGDGIEVVAGTGERKARKCTVFVNAAVQPHWMYRNILRQGSEGQHCPAIIVDIRNR